jgi:Amt family ammonium transporter
VQFITGLVPFVYAFVASVILFKLVDALVGMRVSERDELMGLDLTQHKESSYTVLD